MTSRHVLQGTRKHGCADSGRSGSGPGNTMRARRLYGRGWTRAHSSSTRPSHTARNQSWPRPSLMRVTACFSATKVSPNHFGRADLLKAADDSLRRLQSTILISINSINRTMPFPSRKPLARWRSWWTPAKCGLSASATFLWEQLQTAQQAMRKQPHCFKSGALQPYRPHHLR